MKIAHGRNNALIVIGFAALNVSDMDISPLNKKWDEAIEIRQVLSDEMFYKMVLNPGTFVTRRAFMRKHVAVSLGLEKKVCVMFLSIYWEDERVKIETAGNMRAISKTWNNSINCRRNISYEQRVVQKAV